MRSRLPGTPRPGSVLRDGAALLVLAALVAAAGSAQASTSTKFYAASVAPGTAAAGSASARLTLTLTDATASTQTLGSANFTAPSGWTIGSPASASATTAASDEGGRWTVANAANVIQL